MAAMTMTLKAIAREAGKNLKDLRGSGMIPSVVYGAGRETVSVSVNNKEFTKIWKEAGESATVVLETPNGKVDVLIHEVTLDPIKHIPDHVDFLAIDVNKPIEVEVPIEFTGVSPFVKSGSGVLVKVLHALEVRGLSKDIPHSVALDISSLVDMDSQITVGDVKLPSGVEALSEATDIVCAITSVAEETDEAAGPIDFSGIEVEKKGKKEEEAPAGE